MRDIKYDKVLRKCRENDAAEMYVANTIWPTDEGPVSGKAVAAALATKQPLITPEHKLPAELVEGGGGSAEWGGITGDIADQQDLQEALGGKLDTGAVGVTVAGLVDGKVPVGNIPSLNYLPLTGGTLTGNLSLGTLYTLTVAYNTASTLRLNNEGGITIGSIGGHGASNRYILIGQYASVQSAAQCICIGQGSRVEYCNHAAAIGLYVTTHADGQLVTGKYNVTNTSVARITGGGTGTSARLNIEELDWSGNLYIAGGYSSAVTEIPSATSAYTLSEGCYSHTPSMPPVYTLPDISDATRTHSVSLKVVFSAGALSCMFLDASGAEITPDGDPPAIGDGTVVDYLCEWEASQLAWTIMPLVVVEGNI